MNTRKFKQRTSVIRQESADAPVQHLGYITREQRFRVLPDTGFLKQTDPRSPTRLISVEIDGQEISLDAEFSEALLQEFFLGFTGFGEDSYDELMEYLREINYFDYFKSNNG